MKPFANGAAYRKSRFLRSGFGTTGPSHRARIPSTAGIAIANADRCGSALDVERATFTRRSQLRASPDVLVEQTWFAPRSERSALVMELVARNPSAQSVTLSLAVSPNTTSRDIAFESGADPLGSGCVLATGRTHEAETQGGDTFGVAVCSTPIPRELVVPANSTRAWRFLTTIFVDVLDGGSERPEVQASKLYARLLNDSTLLPRHVAAWASVYRAGIEIETRSACRELFDCSLLCCQT